MSGQAEVYLNGVHPQSNGTTSHSIENKDVDFSAIIIGAGFGGLRMLYELRKLGVSAKVIEAGSGVGGTWYWNRYPGARTDSESWVYILTFLEKLDLNWTWKERFPTQPEVQEYLNHVTDHLGLRKDIQFNTRVTAAHFIDDVWKVTTAQGDVFTCKYLISASGVLSAPLKPPFPGLETFKGEWYQTGLWPKHKVDFTGKRVAVIGTGATAVQVIPVVAHAAKHLTVFQRTPNFVIPARNHPLTEAQMSEIRRDYEKVLNRARGQIFGMDMVDATRTIADMKDDVEHQRVLEAGWEAGGFRYIFESFADMLTDVKSNQIAADFVKNKIHSIVRDQTTASLLCPDHPILSKRPPLGHHYYETFNRPNVSLISVKHNPIREVTPTGLTLSDGQHHEVDLIIFAVGFDAITGTLSQIDLRGSTTNNNPSSSQDPNPDLATQLKTKMQTAYGITVEGFPNFFLISGPQSPFANIPVVIDNTVDWIGKAISHMQSHQYSRMDTKKELAEHWVEQVNNTFNATVLPKGSRESGSWYVGANVEGKQQEVLFYFGGVGPYFKHCQQEVADGYPGYVFSKA